MVPLPNRKFSVSMHHPLGDIEYLANWVVGKTQCIAKLSNCIVNRTATIKYSCTSLLESWETGADPGGGPGGPGPPLTLGFEAPKLSIFGPYLIFPQFFFASLRSAYYFFNMLLIHSSNWKIFPASLRSACDFSPRNLSFTHFRLLGVHLSLSCF